MELARIGAWFFLSGGSSGWPCVGARSAVCCDAYIPAGLACGPPQGAMPVFAGTRHIVAGRAVYCSHSVSSGIRVMGAGRSLAGWRPDSLGARGRDPSLPLCLGFATNPVMALGKPSASPLYSECLARLLVGETIVLSASDFIAQFEASNVIGSLDVAMVAIVLDVLEEEPGISLGCNVSPYSLDDNRTWRAILDCLQARPYLAERLYLEITESCPLDEIEGAAERLAEAKRLGCKLAIDDFGAGYATSRYLHGVEIDWDIVKLDKSCFGSHDGLVGDRRRFQSQMALSAAFAPIVVVEGIETERHLDIALSAGARYGQGWLFGEPASSWASGRADRPGRAFNAGLALPAGLPCVSGPMLPVRAR